MVEVKLGATGNFPNGKLNKDDEGELKIGVAHDKEGLVHINFGKPVAWVAMPSDRAMNFARSIMEHAGVKSVSVKL